MTTPESGLPVRDFSSLFPPLKAPMGRIFFFRHYILAGSLITPPVSLNGAYAGDSLPGEYFYIDTYKGKYHVEISEGYTLDLQLSAGEERFILMDLGGTGIFYDIIPKVANPEVARRQIIQIHEMKERVKEK
ncbi:MAG: DUF2846 domain-containing protein [Deltaproteobacteria bacterium]|nr:DUF2846 domain-containing protein [Deltaproteobacteria bacterium]